MLVYEPGQNRPSGNPRLIQSFLILYNGKPVLTGEFQTRAGLLCFFVFFLSVCNPDERCPVRPASPEEVDWDEIFRMQHLVGKTPVSS